MSNKTRLDLLVFEKGFAESREKAKAVIMAGQVYVDNQKADKAGLMVSEDSVIEFRGGKNPYVSRGGFKLEKALEAFSIDLTGFCCMDVGASTGGFTDCMLQKGAIKVYSVDVGYGQLAWKLRSDPRVVSLERTNARYLTAEQVPESLDFISIDVSFISLTLILPAIKAFLKPMGQINALIKPQFEAGRDKVGKKGVVREPGTHSEVIEKIVDFSEKLDLTVLHLDFSPIKGPEGNIEYLLHLQNKKPEADFAKECITKVVEASHSTLS